MLKFVFLYFLIYLTAGYVFCLSVKNYYVYERCKRPLKLQDGSFIELFSSISQVVYNYQNQTLLPV